MEGRHEQDQILLIGRDDSQVRLLQINGRSQRHIDRLILNRLAQLGIVLLQEGDAGVGIPLAEGRENMGDLDGTPQRGNTNGQGMGKVFSYNGEITPRPAHPPALADTY